MSEFENEVLSITKNFIQTISIIDDKVNFTNSDESFNVNTVVRKFADDGKICTVHNFLDKSDIERFVKVSQNSDITILDWKMNLSQMAIDMSDGNNEDDEDDEDDEEGSKGHNTIEILKQIISYQQNRFKLFVIYTDETEFTRIINEIFQNLSDICLDPCIESPFSLTCNSNKIIVLGKEAVKKKVTLMKELFERCYNYEELPYAIYKEYSIITKGVVSSIFLKSITSLRDNTYCLLSAFHNNLDSAFISHKSVLPEPDNAHEHILNLIGSEVKSIICENVSNELINSIIEKYIDSLEHLTANFEIKEEIREEYEIPLILGKEHIKDVQANNILNSSLLSGKALKDQAKIQINRECINELPKLIVKGKYKVKSKSDINSEVKQANIEFAKLTTIKNHYGTQNNSILTLGVIVESLNEKIEKEYYVCIQPKCDSVRISESENQIGRRFIFLQLQKTKAKGEIIVSDKLCFNVIYKTANLKSFVFKAENGLSSIISNSTDSELCYIDINGKKFKYICELKNDFSQSIVNNYAAQLSRVGMNHSEWLRLNNLKF